MIGTSFPKSKLEKIMHETKVPNIIDMRKYTIYYPADFLNSRGPESLHWGELGYLREHDRSGDSTHAIGGIDLFMSSLLDHLVKKGVFTMAMEPCKGDYLIKGQGIRLDLTSRYDRMDISPNSGVVCYFPRKKEDAVAIAKSFFSGPTFVTRVVSVHNVPWDISRKLYHADRQHFYGSILSDQKELRSEFLKRIGHEDPKFVNAEY